MITAQPQLPPQTQTETIDLPQLALLPPPAASRPEPTGESTPPPAPVPHSARKPTRNGKIARLPYPERDMVNRMLRNNISHDKIVDALDEHNMHVTKRNVSNWKTRGGYAEWCLQQDRALEKRLLQDNLIEHLRKNDASQLPEVGLQLAATHLSEFFLKPETRDQLSADPEKYARTISILCRLAGQIHTLQKYRDDSARELGYKFNPEHIKREVEKHVEITREVFSAEKLGQSAYENDTPHRNYLPRNWDSPT
jgi:hypothetical protein